MIRDIKTNLDIIAQSNLWANKYQKESFPREVLKNYRRKLRRIAAAVQFSATASAILLSFLR